MGERPSVAVAVGCRRRGQRRCSWEAGWSRNDWGTGARGRAQTTAGEEVTGINMTENREHDGQSKHQTRRARRKATSSRAKCAHT